MKIIVNGVESEVKSTALSEILDELGYGDAKVATAVNERFVAAASRPQLRLVSGDRLEVVTPRQGG
ncbi:MAG TPA: sulfur carrier protein ThiS [Paracoccaceae bacterium]|nr:sulfur carrier protein ThiS [Paracoccaceae bacterium]